MEPVKVTAFQATLYEGVAVAGSVGRLAQFAQVPHDTMTKWINGTRVPPKYVQTMMTAIVDRLRVRV